ncbi:exo-1,3-beta-glucanase [Hypocenomyce scalaris]|nr:exo-1,3-beta-glucanase [Hypocenomyce scalaris]
MFRYSTLCNATTAILLLAAGTIAAPTSRPAKRALSFDYQNDIVRGVNLGGWFVLEPWITPSIFSEWATTGRTVVDEYTYSQTLGPTEALSRLSSHWNTWITQDDFNQIGAAGFNHVRIPIGYWAVAPLPGDPYVQGQLPILDQAIGWARNASLKVLIDLHGAPGSQNGFDNSGRYGPVDWQQGNTVNETLNAIQGLAERYTNQTDVVTAIELLNEPLDSSINMDELKTFYLNGYGVVRDSNSDTAVTIHDAFENIDTYWNGFMNAQSGCTNVILDTHQYQVFSQAQVSETLTEHISSACALGPQLAGTDKWTIVGEWSGAQTDCAQWLNGLGLGARYDGTLAGSSYVGACTGGIFNGTVADLSSTEQSNIRQFIEAQMDAYEEHTGWIYWCWKTESAPEWNVQELLAAGLFPQPLTSREFTSTAQKCELVAGAPTHPMEVGWWGPNSPVAGLGRGRGGVDEGRIGEGRCGGEDRRRVREGGRKGGGKGREKKEGCCGCKGTSLKAQSKGASGVKAQSKGASGVKAQSKGASGVKAQSKGASGVKAQSKGASGVCMRLRRCDAEGERG